MTRIDAAMKRLVDAYERKIDYLRISVTDRCNLRCVYCMPPEGIDLIESAGILRYEEFLRIARVAAAHGVTKIRVTGGEPLVRKGIIGFLRSLASLDGLTDLSLTTNGVLLKDYAAMLKEAGLKRVNVSLDSMKRDRFRKMTRGDNLEQVLEGLEEALNVGLVPVKINMVAIKGFNDDEILDFARLSLEKPYHVRYIEYMPFNTQEGWQRDKCISAKELKEMIERGVGPLEPVAENAGNAGPAKRYRFKDAPGEVGFISPVSEHFCGSCNRLRLTSDGKLRNCLFSDREVDLRAALRDGSDDKVIEDLLFKAVMEKPQGHQINENIFKKCSRTMSLIGG
ncbi:MAG: GTP 3',8-cyclase MoaA [Deltaproteobacteria bacterium]|nr:GTP 3',8-cyclase MoaA [Deltaproteobacteria bacterium]